MKYGGPVVGIVRGRPLPKRWVANLGVSGVTFFAGRLVVSQTGPKGRTLLLTHPYAKLGALLYLFADPKPDERSVN